MTFRLWSLPILAGLLWPNAAFGQSTPRADSASETLPEPSHVAEPSPAKSSSKPAPLPSTLPLSAPINLPPPPPVYDGIAPPWENGTLGPAGQMIGWFGTVEIGLFIPHVNSHLSSGNNIQAPVGSSANVANVFSRPITLPMAPLDWTGAPRVRVGYRFADGAGNVQLEWRMAASQGSSSIPHFDAAGAGLLRSQLNVQQATFTYGTSEFLTNAPHIDRVWAVRFGVSAADVFFDSRAQGQQILNQAASNSFAGVGPALAFQFHKPLAKSRVSLYGEVDATGLWGFTRQHFSETVAGDDGAIFSDSAPLQRLSNAVGIFGVEGGLSFAPWQDRCWRFTLGYQWQRWWWVGQSDDSNADLTLQGIIFRGEWRY